MRLILIFLVFVISTTISCNKMENGLTKKENLLLGKWKLHEVIYKKALSFKKEIKTKEYSGYVYHFSKEKFVEVIDQQSNKIIEDGSWEIEEYEYYDDDGDTQTDYNLLMTLSPTDTLDEYYQDWLDISLTETTLKYTAKKDDGKIKMTWAKIMRHRK